jgi:hypothetical protein
MTVWRPRASYSRIIAPLFIVAETLDALRRFGLVENIVYWAGAEEGDHARISRLIEPEAHRTRRYVHVAGEEVARIVNEVYDRGEILIVQLHTHPAAEDHSETDDCGTVSKRNGFISLVVPFYALLSKPEAPLWFGYELQDGGWFEFDVAKRLVAND